LIHEPELLKRYGRKFNRTTLRLYGLRGGRLRDVNRRLINLLAENAALDKLVGDHMGHERERVTLFGQVYSVRMGNLVYQCSSLAYLLKIIQVTNAYKLTVLHVSYQRPVELSSAPLISEFFTFIGKL